MEIPVIPANTLRAATLISATTRQLLAFFLYFYVQTPRELLADVVDQCRSQAHIKIFGGVFAASLE
jgi:hypothetical protein